jgi:YHS domain-containing protein
MSRQHSLISFATGLTTALVLLFSAQLHAGADTETDANGVILAGHDAVAYFTENKPVPGSSSYTAVYNGAIYRFSTDRNRDLFNAAPEKYAPQYGGFCAYGMTFGKKFEVDGKAFEVVDGKLYVNKNLEVYEAWKKDVPKHIAEAEQEWPRVKGIAAAKL